MKLIKSTTFWVLLVIMSACGTGKIAPDSPDTEGVGPGAAKVLQLIKDKMTEIRSISAVMEATTDSEMYGFEKGFEGTLKVEFGGKPGTIGNRWFETEQSGKGKTNKLRGVVTKEGLKELYLLKKKVVKGGADASPKARISFALYRPYGFEKFFDELEGKKMFEDYPAQKTNTYLKGIETISGVECYVIATYNPESKGRIRYYYFGTEDLLFYGDKYVIDSEDGRFVHKTTVKSIEINKELPEFDVEVPADFAVEMFVPFGEEKTLEVGIQAPLWTLENAAGGQSSLSDFKGQLVLMDFWATWCGPCKAKMPHIQELHEKYKDKGLKVISILSSDKGHEEAAKKYIKDKGYTFDMVYGYEQLSDDYRIRFLPTVILVDKEGKIIYHRDSPGVNDGVDEDVEIEEAITSYLKIKA